MSHGQMFRRETVRPKFCTYSSVTLVMDISNLNQFLQILPKNDGIAKIETKYIPITHGFLDLMLPKNHDCGWNKFGTSLKQNYAISYMNRKSEKSKILCFKVKNSMLPLLSVWP